MDRGMHFHLLALARIIGFRHKKTPSGELGVSEFRVAIR